MHKKITVFTTILVVALVMVQLYWKVPGVQEKIASYTEEDFESDNIYSDLDSLAQRLDEEILKEGDSFTVYLKDMDVSEINRINSSLNGIFGSGETYQQIGTVGEHYKKVKITMKRTDNYYVLKAYRDGKDISEGGEKAQKLYDVIKSLLEEVIAAGMTDYDKELALHDYLVANCEYSSDTTQNPESDIYRAYGALVNGNAVCNGYAEAMQLLLMCVGVETRFVVGTADGVEHAWNLVKLGSDWYHLDATWDDPLPDEEGRVIHPYFNVTDAVLAQSHDWKKEEYPMAEHMEYNYYVKSQNYFADFESYKEKTYEVMVSHGKHQYEAAIEEYQESEEDMQFIFDGNYRYNSINWQTYGGERYHVLVLNAR